MRIRTRRLTKQCTNSGAKAVNKVTTNIQHSRSLVAKGCDSVCVCWGVDIRFVLEHHLPISVVFHFVGGAGLSCC